MDYFSFSLDLLLSSLLCFAAVGVTLSLNGKVIANDSFVNADDIGENDDALHCQTDKKSCCRYGVNRFGEWYFPNGTRVGMREGTRDNYFYRNRGDKIVRLNRRHNPPERGQFHCEVPDADGVNQTVFVNIGMYFEEHTIY